MTVVGFVAFFALLVVVTTGRRMIRHRTTPLVLWPLLLLAAASPVVMAWLVLFPGPPIAERIVQGVGDQAHLDVGPGQELMITATLAPLPEDQVDSSAQTDYALHVSGSGFSQSVTGTIKRGLDGDVDAELFSGQGVQSADVTRSTRMGEDLQNRYALDGLGAVVVEVTNWHGDAAQALKLQIVKAPPRSRYVWAFVALVSALGIWCDVRRGTDRLTTDVAFLAFWAAYLRDGVTPLDDWQEVGLAMAGALISGWVVGRFIAGGVGTVLGSSGTEGEDG